MRMVSRPKGWVRPLLAALLAGLIGAPNLSAQDRENIAEVIGAGREAVLVERVPPEYPQAALEAGVEGWVILSFSVDETGKTADIRVTDSSIEGYFEAAAMAAVAKWTYQPALVGGRPSVQINKQARTTFTLPDSTGATSEKFKRSYDKIVKALDQGKTKRARRLLDKLKKDRQQLLAEVCYLDMLEAIYWREVDDAEQSLDYLERALFVADGVISRPAYLMLLRNAVVQNAQANRLATALRRYDKLTEADINLAPDDSIHEAAETIRGVLGSDTRIVTAGTVTICQNCPLDVPYWRQPLNRNRFAIDSLTGNLSEVEILCGFHTASLKYDSQTVWTVQRKWGECDVRVFGDEGAKLRLVEYPRTAADQ